MFFLFALTEALAARDAALPGCHFRHALPKVTQPATSQTSRVSLMIILWIYSLFILCAVTMQNFNVCAVSVLVSAPYARRAIVPFAVLGSDVNWGVLRSGAAH
jgi:hypothetical protein